jgi:predicted DNA-binding WGR domain protein
MTDQPFEDREDAEPEAADDLLESQEGKGYGEDEGEREQSLPDE